MSILAASNGISDVGLSAIALNLLLPSPSPNGQLPTIKRLLLQSNNIRLQGSTPHLLSTALSHPAAQLQLLLLNNNTGIAAEPDRLAAFMRNLEPTSLVHLQLNACDLEPEDAKTITKWISDPNKGGRIAALEVSQALLRGFKLV